VSLLPPDALPAVTPVIDVLEGLRVRYHIGGSFAIAAYGIPRASADVDVVAELRFEHVDMFVSQLEAQYYVNRDRVREAIEERGSFNLIHLARTMKVDVFVPERTRFAEQEQNRARPEIFEFASNPRVFYVKSPEDLVLRKLRWYRQGNETSERQWSDVVGLIKAQADRLDGNYLVAWAAELGVGDLLERAIIEADTR
jgi:hypothetical protein